MAYLDYPPITQADREAAARVAWKSPKFLYEIRAGQHDDADVVQAFAAHRIAAEQATVEKIVVWLRESAAWHEKHDDGLSGFDGIRQGQSEAANAIEQGDWRNG